MFNENVEHLSCSHGGLGPDDERDKAWLDPDSLVSTHFSQPRSREPVTDKANDTATRASVGVWTKRLLAQDWASRAMINRWRI